jgi:hypothetical protein
MVDTEMEVFSHTTAGQNVSKGCSTEGLIMREMPLYPLHRSIRRFWNPVESRYWMYERPSLIEAECERCKARYFFTPEAVPTHEYQAEHGGYRVLNGRVCGLIVGRGACGGCGRAVTSIHWPNSAYIKITVTEGILWSWNSDQLLAIRAYVAGDKVGLRRILMNDARLSRIIGRIPTFAKRTKNRTQILRAIDRYLKG